MGTLWSEVITNYAMVVTDDEKMREKLAVSPALFFRELSLWVQTAMPLCSRPPELLAFLSEGLKAPSYADAEWVSTHDSTVHETVVETGKTGFSICSCVIAQPVGAGDVTFLPYHNFTYDAETGDVTFPQQDNAGTEYRLDFYTDGEFLHDLTDTQKRLMGMAIAVTWDNRFNRNWLNMQPKPHDKSFDIVNENSTMKESASRYLKNLAAFNQELAKYEQDCAYMHAVNPYRRVFALI